MSPISNSQLPSLQILNLLNLDEVINISNIDPTMKFLLARHDKIAVGDSKIFFLDPYTLRNYEDTESYCESLNMTVALPKGKSENDLIAMLLRKWDNNIRSKKFNWIEAWLAIGLTREKFPKGESLSS